LPAWRGSPRRGGRAWAEGRRWRRRGRGGSREGQEAPEASSPLRGRREGRQEAAEEVTCRRGLGSRLGSGVRALALLLVTLPLPYNALPPNSVFYLLAKIPDRRWEAARS